MTKRICISCGIESQRSGKSWELWGQCANCAKRSNPDYYNVLKCKECGSTSNNTTALCWKLYGKCGKCTYRKSNHNNYHVLCKECNEIVYKLSYVKLGRHSINLFYCIKCGGIISPKGYRILMMGDLVV